MKKNRTFIAIIAVILCLCLAGACLSACGKAAEEPAKENQQIGERSDRASVEAKSESDKAKEEENKEPEEPDISSPSVCGRLSVEGTQLVDESGEAVQLRGLSTHGLSFYPQYVNEALFGQLRQEWKANVIRLAMYTAESGGYCTDGDKEYLKNLVRRGVEYAANQDLYVIVDWHILSDGNPNQYTAEAIDFFAQMTKEFSGYENVIYEICNEPNGGTSWGEIKSYAQKVIPVIRANAPDAVILVGTPNWSQYVNEAAADPITGYDNIMYTLHFYAATHKDDLRNTMTAAIDAGLPVFVSEYGICDASGNGGIDEAQANAWVQVMDQYKVSYVAWNISNKNETSAIIQSAVEKTSGFSEEDLSDSGRWLYQILTGDALPADSGQAPAVQSGSRNTAVQSGDMKVTAVLDNSWEANGQQFYQYMLTVKNTSDQPCESWKADLMRIVNRGRHGR
ncbi:cellulase family glycosylhydrolase [uncultured Dysosmobacter sp.]|uniref:cellulase family glycosylhydrolase n=1 Tax=uncultured Dysosmobacter sp. TaxID=2591384 RepID=UPI002619BD8E|nr:cellulase family glycosylhydrolase [uncultured Dysosmobacter sp.]